MIHVTKHALHRVTELVRDCYPLVDLLINHGKLIFLKAPTRIQLFKALRPYLRLPPKPVIIRWGTWLEAANNYAEKYKSVKRVISELEYDFEAIKKAKFLIKNSEVVSQYWEKLKHTIRWFRKN